MITNSFEEANKLDFLKNFLEEEKKDDNLRKLIEAFQSKITKIEEGKSKSNCDYPLRHNRCHPEPFK